MVFPSIKKFLRLTGRKKGKGEDFKHIIEFIAPKFKASVSEYCYEAVVEKLQKDLGTIFLMQPQLNKSLSEIIKKFNS